MRKESSLVNSLLMKRYLAIHKARDASIIGLVVGTLGIGRSTLSLSLIRQITQNHTSLS